MEFDKKYVEIMVDDHKADVDAFQEQADDGENTEMSKHLRRNICRP